MSFIDEIRDTAKAALDLGSEKADEIIEKGNQA